MTLKDKLNQFVIDLNGQWVEVSDRTNTYQCYDLAANWVIALGIPKSTISHLYAYEVYTKPNPNTRDYFDLIPNTATFIPQDGDIAVFDKTPGNIAGHIGIALGGGTTKSFNLFNQNAPLGSNAHIGSYNYNNPKLLGVLRPKNQQVSLPGQPVITDQTRIPQLGNMEVQQIRSKLSDLERDSGQLVKDVKSYKKQLEECEQVEVTTTTYPIPTSPETPVKTALLPSEPSFTIAGYNVYFIKNG